MRKAGVRGGTCPAPAPAYYSSQGYQPSQPNQGTFRTQGTVYGRSAAGPAPAQARPANRAPAYPTTYQAGARLDHSGPLTGHILAQRHTDRPTPQSRTA